MEYNLRPDFIYMARHPEIFRGERKHRNFFEGWYYNVKTRDGKPFVVIPGISKDEDGNGHAFVQIIDDGVSRNVIYPMSAVSFRDKPFLIKIDKNEFSLFSMKIDIKHEDIRYQGELYFKNAITLKKSRYAPSIMGPFAYCAYMQCNHGILCITADAKGCIDTGKKEMDFEDGSIYIEKDWGSSFPKKYVWVQCNCFEEKKTSLSLSIADVPFLGFSFRGVIAVLRRGKRQNIFATYHFASVKKLEITKEGADIELKQGKLTLKVKVQAANALQLLAPNMGKMSEYVFESVDSKVNVKLLYKNNLLHESKGESAGYEYRGF